MQDSSKQLLPPTIPRLKILRLNFELRARSDHKAAELTSHDAVWNDETRGKETGDAQEDREGRGAQTAVVWAGLATWPTGIFMSVWRP